MTLFAFLAIAAAGAAGCTAARDRLDILRVTAALALAVCLIAAIALPPGATLALGDSSFVLTSYARGWLIAMCGAFLIAHLVAAGTSWQRNLPIAMLATIGASALALSAQDVTTAFLAAAIGAFACLGATLLLPVSATAVRTATDGLRIAAVAVSLAVLGGAWTDSRLAGEGVSAVTIAFGLVAAGVAVRVGAFPAHAPAARLAQTSPLLAVPLLLAWVPALLGTIALGWADQRLLPVGTPASLASLVVVGVALVTIVFAGLGAVVQDDLGQIARYSTIQDAAFILLAFAAPAEASSIARGWIVVFAVTKTALFALVAALAAAYETRVIGDLRGWVRRSPPLGAALIAIAVATYGWPGLLPWESRWSALQPWLAAITPLAMLVALLPLVPLARLLAVGVQTQGANVLRGFGARPARVPYVRSGSRRTGRAITTVVGEAVSALGYVRLAWRLNRAPIAAALVLVLSLAPLALAFATSPVTSTAGDGSPLAAPSPSATR